MWKKCQETHSEHEINYVKLISEAGFFFYLELITTQPWVQFGDLQVKRLLAVYSNKTLVKTMCFKFSLRVRKWDVTLVGLQLATFSALKRAKMDFYIHFMRWMCKKSSSSICVIRTMTRSHDKHVTQKRELVKY